jgi:hypothetical protein
MALAEVKDAEFDGKVVHGPRPAAVKFWAEW